MHVGSSATVGRLRLAERTWSQLSASECLALLHLPFEKLTNTRPRSSASSVRLTSGSGDPDERARCAFV